MQNYKVIHGNSSVKSSRTIINDDIQTAISNNSGTAFPTANLMEGMKCYRTDLKRTFTLVDVDTKKWEPDDAGGTAKTANKLTTARTINVTGKATGSAQFDGSADINIKLTTVNADTATTATVANSAKACTGNSVTASQVAWNGVIGKPSSYPPAAHNHDAAYPSTTGARASGTWNINVTGTAGGVSWNNVQGRPGVMEPYYANNKWYAVGDDVYMGDHNIGGCLCLKSTNGNTGLALFQKSNEQNYGSITFDGSNFVASHTIKGTVTNATKAGTADNVQGQILVDSNASPKGYSALLTVKRASAGTDSVPNNGTILQVGPTGSAYNGKLYITDNGTDGVWLGGIYNGKESGWTRLVENKGTWNISVTGNAASASSVAWGNVTGKPATATRWPSWDEVSCKPRGIVVVNDWDPETATLHLMTMT